MGDGGRTELVHHLVLNNTTHTVTSMMYGVGALFTRAAHWNCIHIHVRVILCQL